MHVRQNSLYLLSVWKDLSEPQSTVLVLNIEAAGHDCWVTEVYSLGIYVQLFKL